jgi:hypothetical protein
MVVLLAICTVDQVKEKNPVSGLQQETHHVLKTLWNPWTQHIFELFTLAMKVRNHYILYFTFFLHFAKWHCGSLNYAIGWKSGDHSLLENIPNFATSISFVLIGLQTPR